MERLPREQFGVVGAVPLDEQDLGALIFPSATAEERQAVLEGLTFFTTPHTAAEGLGPDANQAFCLGCHANSAEVPRGAGLISTSSPISRAARSTPTNFEFTALDPVTGGGRAPDHDVTVDLRTGAITGTGKTAAFTLFGDFKLATDSANPLFDPLDTTGPHFTQPHFPRLFPPPFQGSRFGGAVQHVRPSLSACLPDRIPPIEIDPNLPGVTVDPRTGLLNPPTGISPITGFRRAVGERAAPPYVGRGMIEAIPDEDILALGDPMDQQGHTSSLSQLVPGDCSGDCIAGRPNLNSSEPTNAGVVGGDFPPRSDTGTTVRLGRFGLRAAGPTLVQFMVGGLQGELDFTSPLRLNKVTQSDINLGRPGCITALGPTPNVPLSTVLSLRALVRLTPTPEFGHTLLKVLKSPDPTEPRSEENREARVQRGAMLFGIDLVAFANRMLPGRMPQGGDGLDPHAINQADRKLNCVGCHIPIQRTGQSPAEVGAEHLSFVWAPIWSDLLIHKMAVIDAERLAPTPRDPLLIFRGRSGERAEGDDQIEGASDDAQDRDNDRAQGRLFATFDIPRNFADDALPTQGSANGDLWRTAPLMGLGRVGPPFFHDARVYLSRNTAKRTPASTVMTSSEFTNAPLVVRTLDDAIRAAIELHDLPAPDDHKTPNDVPGAGCPVPPHGSGHVGAVDYGLSPETIICPPFRSEKRSEAKEVIRRYRALSPEDQEAVIEFLKEL